MNEMKTITFNGQPFEVVDVAARASIDGLTADKVGAEPAFSVLSVLKGGTGSSSVNGARTNLGIGTRKELSAGVTGEVTFPKSGAFLVSAINNAHNGVLAVTTSNTGIQGVAEIIPLRRWSYSHSTDSLTMSITLNSEFNVSVAITTLQTPSNLPFTEV